MERYAVLRTHGGLGNQLFQILFGRLFAQSRGLTLREAHDLRYPHAFVRSGALGHGDAPSPWQSLVSAARVPKVLMRVLGHTEEWWSLGRSVYLDGYFQSAEIYKAFAGGDIADQLGRLAEELTIGPANLDSCLIHMRVGDFFADPVAAKAHVLARLQEAPQFAHVMTNDEPLLRQPEVAECMLTRGAILVSTQGMSAEEVLRTMARYVRIDANDSTLTFWASVLAGCQVHLRDMRLRDCRDFLARHRSGYVQAGP